jgi:hypothetical protein
MIPRFYQFQILEIDDEGYEVDEKNQLQIHDKFQYLEMKILGRTFLQSLYRDSFFISLTIVIS